MSTFISAIILEVNSEINDALLTINKSYLKDHRCQPNCSFGEKKCGTCQFADCKITEKNVGHVKQNLINIIRIAVRYTHILHYVLCCLQRLRFLTNRQIIQ